MIDDAPTAAAFRADPDLQDWRGTFDGVHACFPCGFAEGVRLVASVGEAAERTGVEPDIDLRPRSVTVTIRHDDAERFRAAHLELGRAVSTAAAALGLRADPTRVQAVHLFVAAAPGVDVEPFWEAALGYEPVGEDGAVDPQGRNLPISFHELGNGRAGRGRTHVDVSVPAEEAEARVAAALAAGGRLVDDSYAPEWWSLASPDNHGVDIATWPDRGSWSDLEARRSG